MLLLQDNKVIKDDGERRARDWRGPSPSCVLLWCCVGLSFSPWRVFSEIANRAVLISVMKIMLCRSRRPPASALAPSKAFVVGASWRAVVRAPKPRRSA